MIIPGSYLAHHGIKGQKWGVRRYQDKNGRLTAAGKARLKDSKIDRKINEYVKHGSARISDFDSYSVGLTDITMHDGSKWVSGLMHGHDFDWREVSLYGDTYYSPATMIRNDPTSHRFDENSSIALTHSLGMIDDQDLIDTNPGYGQRGTTQNCAKCSSVLELRLRGYNINAGRQSYPSASDAPELWWKGARRVDYAVDDADYSLRSYGRNTSGTLSFRYPNGAGGHAVHWTNDTYGRFEIQDGQNGRRFSSVKEMLDTYGGDTKAHVATYRLDNCEPNWDFIEQDSVIRTTQNSKVFNVVQKRFVDTW